MERRATEKTECGDCAFTPAYAADTFRNVGAIADINLSVMGFQYPASKESSAKPANLFVFLSVEPDIHINRISCEVVYDLVITDLSPDDPTVRRRVSVIGPNHQGGDDEIYDLKSSSVPVFCRVSRRVGRCRISGRLW